MSEEKSEGLDFIDWFLKGQRDCKEGIPHKSGFGEYYDRGYAAQYELEQVTTHYGLSQTI